MGYLDPKKSKPGDQIAWNESENAFIHPWSLERRLYNFGYFRQSEVFGDVMKFLEAPADLVDLITTKVAEGASKRAKDDAERTPRGKNPLGLTSEELKQISKL